MLFGVQALPVRSEEPPVESSSTLFFSFATWLTASITDDVGTSTITSTLSTSNHWRAMLEPTSGLFW